MMSKKKFKGSRKSKHKPPSRIRYEHNNPVVSFRVKKEWYEEFKKFLDEQQLSIGDFFRIAFSKQKRNYAISRNHGYKKAKNEWAIWFFCDICGKKSYILPYSKVHQYIIDYLKGKWGHDECIEQKKQQEGKEEQY